MRFLICLTLVCACTTASARMYEWSSPSSGRAEFSGSPPAWYRSGSGPRVWVYENGNLIDDTAIKLSPAQNQLLRETAFEEMEQRKSAKRLERLAARLAASRRQQDSQGRRATSADAEQEGRQTRLERTASAGTGTSASEAAAGEAAPADSELIEQFKALVRAFDEQSRGAGNPGP